METFTQIIFPPKPKPIVPAIVRPATSYHPATSRTSGAYDQDQVFCDMKGNWRPMVDCLACKKPTKPLKIILLTGLGC